MELGIAFFVLAFFVVLNCVYYGVLSKIVRYKELPVKNNSDPVSIIVCSKNEEDNLRELIPLLLKQNHPNFELILINDASVDNTKEVIEEFMDQDNRVKMVDVINNESFWGNKKYALTLGIKKAIHHKHLFIDADCRPVSNKWISLMAAKLNGDKTIVLGYGGYKRIKGSFLNALIRYETILTVFQYIGYALKGNPYMGVGRNMGYTNDQFYAVKGFINHMKIMGGDDDLFVNEASTATNTAIQLDPDSFTVSAPKSSWQEWLMQKKRHVNTSKYYKTGQKFLLGLFYFSQLGFFIALIAGFSFGNHWQFILALLLIRYIVVWCVMGLVLSRFRESELIPIFPFIEVSLVITQLYLFFNMGGKTKTWK